MVTHYSTQMSVAYHPRFRFSDPKRGLIHCPGNGADAFAYALFDYGNVKALTDAGIPVASLPHGNRWGNTEAQGYVTALRTHAQTNWGFEAGTVDLIGGSAGGLLALNWARANPTLVRRIGLIIPAIDLLDIYDNPTYTTEISTAWGGAPIPADNPADNTEELLGIPIKCWYSTDDPICDSIITENFATAVGAELVSLGAQGHAAPNISHLEVKDFFTQLEV